MSLRAARLALIPFLLYGLYSLFRQDYRIELLLALILVVALAHIGPRARTVMAALLPFGLVGILYDGMRPFQRVGLTAERVHLCDLRALESTIFGFGTGGTLHDYFYVHHWAALDLLCAVPYGTFIFWCMGGSIILYRRGDRAAAQRFAWGFLTLNIMGFITYHVLPAAPPWYFHTHGCVVDLSAHASAGPALGRVDGYLGISYFHGMYSKASSVFGALPSLHCAYPTLIAIEGWRTFGPRLRVASVLYAMLMIFSAMYLDHHWLIDASLGVLYAFFVAGLFRALRSIEWRSRSSAAITSPALTPSSDSPAPWR